MTNYDAPMRVFAVINANEDEVNFLGFGTYVGDELIPSAQDGFSEEEYQEVEALIRDHDKGPPPIDAVKAIQWEIDEGHTDPGQFEQRLSEVKQAQEARLARPLRERAHEILERMAHNPKIELDNGDVVWGYQCWWGPEERFEEIARGRTVKHVKIGDYL